MNNLKKKTWNYSKNSESALINTDPFTKPKTRDFFAEIMLLKSQRKVVEGQENTMYTEAFRSPMHAVLPSFSLVSSIYILILSTRSLHRAYVYPKDFEWYVRDISLIPLGYQLSLTTSFWEHHNKFLNFLIFSTAIASSWIFFFLYTDSTFSKI